MTDFETTVCGLGQLLKVNMGPDREDTHRRA